MPAIQNLGLAGVSLLAGLIVDHHGYLWLEVFFIFWLVLATTATVLLWLVDYNSETKFLNMSTKQRKVLEEEMASNSTHNQADILPSQDESIY